MFTYLGEHPESGSGSSDDKSRSYTRKVLVRASSYTEGKIGAINAAGIVMFEPYVFGSEIDLQARAKTFDAERVAPNSLVWVVTVGYKTPEDGQEEDQENENPTLEKPEMRYDAEKYQEPLIGTASDSEAGPLFEHAHKNSAGEVFVPPPMRDRGRHNFTLVLNRPIDYDFQKEQTDYEDHVNSDAFFGYPAGRVKLNSILPALHYKDLPNNGGIVDYLRVAYNFSVRKTWLHTSLDQGSYYIPAAGPLAGEKVSFKNDDGQPRMGLLNGSGDALPDGDDPVFLDPIKLYPTKAFSGLNLPNSPQDCKKFIR